MTLVDGRLSYFVAVTRKHSRQTYRCYIHIENETNTDKGLNEKWKSIWWQSRVCCETSEGHRHHTHMQESQQKGRGEQILNTEGRGRAYWHLPWCKGIPELARSGGHTAAQGHRKTGQITTQIPTSLSATPPRFCNRSGRLHLSILVSLRFNTDLTIKNFLLSIVSLTVEARLH